MKKWLMKLAVKYIASQLKKASPSAPIFAQGYVAGADLKAMVEKYFDSTPEVTDDNYDEMLDKILDEVYIAVRELHDTYDKRAMKLSVEKLSDALFSKTNPELSAQIKETLLLLAEELATK